MYPQSRGGTAIVHVRQSQSFQVRVFRPRAPAAADLTVTSPPWPPLQGGGGGLACQDLARAAVSRPPCAAAPLHARERERENGSATKCAHGLMMRQFIGGVCYYKFSQISK